MNEVRGIEIVHEGVPSWRYPDGTILPIMAGGQTDEELYGTGPVTGDGGTGTATSNLEDLIGQLVIDANTGAAGTLLRMLSRGRWVYYIQQQGGQPMPIRQGSQIMDEMQRIWSIGAITPTGYKLTPAAPGVPARVEYGMPTVNYTRAAASEDDIARLFGLTVGGGGSTRTAAQEDLDRAQAEYYRSRATIEREQIAAIAKEAAMRTAADLYRDKLNAKTTAQGQQVQLAGQDDWRLLAALAARPPDPNPTPVDVLKSNIRPIANAQLTEPNINMDTAALEGLIGKMQSMNSTVPGAPLAASTAGMKYGGLIGESGIRFGNARRAVLLGEGTGTGTEVGIVTPGMGITEVVPLAGGAAEGATMNDVFSKPIGLPGYQPYIASLYSPDVLSKPADQPSLMSASTTPSTPASPYLNLPVPTYNPDGSIQNLSLTVMPEALQTTRDRMGGRLGYGVSTAPYRVGGGYGQIYGPITIERGLLEAGVAAPEAARLSAQIGNLPNPRTAAGIYSTLNEVEQRMFLSLYKLAGIDPATFKAQVESAMITGPERRMLIAA